MKKIPKIEEMEVICIASSDIRKITLCILNEKRNMVL